MSTPVFDPVGLVNAGWDKFSSIGDQAIGRSLSIASQLANFNIPDVNFDASFQPVQGVMQGFDDPQRPQTPEFEVNFELPEPLEINTVDIPDFGAAPTDDLQPPSLDFSGRPNPLNIPAPPGRPNLFEISIPEAPDIVLPELPDFEQLNIPSPPEALNVEFEGVRPERDFAAPDVPLDFTEEEYSSELLDQTRAEIQRMMEDGLGMPAAVEQMLIDQARARDERDARRAIQEATEDWSRRGFTLPSGVLNGRIDRVKQEAQDRASQLNREVFIQRRQQEVENFRFAVSQGVALESQLIGAHLDVQQRKLEFARSLVQVALDLFNARIAEYNADVQAYQVDAQVFEQLVRAELNKLERFRLQIQAEAEKNEINRTKVEIFVSRVQALDQVVNIYRGQIEAARTVAQTNDSIARSFAAEIDGFRSQVEAKREEFEAWATKIRGELGKVQAFEAETRAFATRVDAYRTGVDAKAVKPRLEVDVEASRVQQNLAQIEAVRTGIQAEAERIRAKSQAFGSEAQMFASEGQIAAAKAETNTRQFLALVEENRTKAEQALGQAQLDVTKVVQSGQILSSALDSAGRITGQLAAGAMSAVNLGASISGSSSDSESTITTIQG